MDIIKKTGKNIPPNSVLENTTNQENNHVQYKIFTDAESEKRPLVKNLGTLVKNPKSGPFFSSRYLIFDSVSNDKSIKLIYELRCSNCVLCGL